MIAAGSLVDPFRLDYYPNIQAYRTTSGKTISDPRLVSGESVGVFICAGQSNICNTVEGTYSIANPTKIDNLNVFDGGMYRASSPMLGCSNNTNGNVDSWLPRLADKLITAGKYDRVIFVPVGRGGSSVTAWVPGAPLNSHLLTAVARCNALGLTVSGVLWQQGEADASAGMSQATYQGHLANVIATIPGPWLIGKSTYVSGTTNSGIRAACDAVVDGVGVFAGADTDSLTATSRQSDNLHFNAAGANSAAGLWSTAIEAAL